MSIALSQLSLHFGNHLIVNDVSLQVSEGELFVLLGASGSGKSTILRLIAGLLFPEAGRITLYGRDVTYLPPQQRGVGFVFQNYSVFRHMTVARNVEFGLRIRNVAEKQRRARRDELLDLVGLVGLGDRFAGQLSGGQLQRVALARALAYEPQVLLLDEPFGALDVKIRAQLRENLKRIQRQLNITTILVTHDQEEAFELADRIGVVENGQLLEVGAPQQLYQTPRTEFVATFVGGGNVLVGRRQGDQIRLGQLTLPFPADAPEHDEETPVRILFRPESVRLQTEPLTAAPDLHPLGRGTIVRRLFTGAAQRVRVEIDGLQGARPIAPSLHFGQRAVQVEALLSGDAAQRLQVGLPIWAAIDRYHVLQPAGLKLLICVDPAGADQVGAQFGTRLATAVAGPATLLAVTADANGVAPLQKWLDGMLPQWRAAAGSQLRSRIRQGVAADEISAEAQEGAYELVLFGCGADSATDARRTDLLTSARQVLSTAELPILLVQSPRADLRKILICTAAGEPGKSDVRFGGRLARRLGAAVTLLHVQRPDAAPVTQRLADKHLTEGRLLLTATGVACQTKTVSGDAVGAILTEAEQEDYDLIVIGAPAPRAAGDIVWSDVTTQIVDGTRRPILIVPMQQ